MDIEELIGDNLETIKTTTSIKELENIKVSLTGKKGKITALSKSLSTLPPEQRKESGKKINLVKTKLLGAIDEQFLLLKEKELNEKLEKEVVDVTLPGRSDFLGTLHPVTKTAKRVYELFSKLGFTAISGDEIESPYFNFTALNIPEHHPARQLHDTFYLKDEKLLRTHVTPVQIHYMKNNKPPFKILSIGRVYRCDSDVTHTPMFHQIDAFVVAENINFQQLKGTLIQFMREFFEQDVKARFRTSYFPFTEPSAEMDITCVHCEGKGCRVCSNTGWLEALGCGMIHPNVLRNAGICPEKYSGFAFGCGIDRLAMLRYKINDLRLLFDNNLSFLKQFNN